MHQPICPILIINHLNLVLGVPSSTPIAELTPEQIRALAEGIDNIFPTSRSKGNLHDLCRTREPSQPTFLRHPDHDLDLSIF